MKPNNAPQHRAPTSSEKRETTDKGATEQMLPGFSGRKIAWSLGTFMLVSLIVIPLGLFLYQGVSDQEKQIQREWPKVAEALDRSYALLNLPLESLPEDQQNKPPISKLWQEARQNFRSRRIWIEQLEAAQTLEDILNTQAAGENNGNLLDYLFTHMLQDAEQATARQSRLDALESYAQFERERLAPYRSALTRFPTQSVLLFFRLPEAPVLREAQSSVVK